MDLEYPNITSMTLPSSLQPAAATDGAGLEVGDARSPRNGILLGSPRAKRGRDKNRKYNLRMLLRVGTIDSIQTKWKMVIFRYTPQRSHVL